MKQAKFDSELTDILSSGDGSFSEYHRKELTNLFGCVKKAKVLRKWIEEFYNVDYGIDEGLSGEELNWVANYLCKTARIKFK